MDFHWTLGKIKFIQVFRTLLSRLADLNYAAVYMISILPLICSSNLFYKPLKSFPSAPTTVAIIIIFMLHSIIITNFHCLRVFHASFNSWFFIGVLVKASLKILISWTVTSGSPFQPIHIFSCTHTICFTVSSLSPHNLHLLFFCVLPIFALI